MHETLSKKIRVLGMIAIFLVVYIHAYNLTFKYGGQIFKLNDPLNLFVQNFVSEGLARIAVPLFFAISGYLFFLNVEGAVRDWYAAKLRKRIFTLAVPYLAWAILAILLFYVMQQVPAVRPFFTNKLIEQYSWRELIEAIFVNPLPYQLWFIRELMVYVLFAPLIYWLLNRMGIIVLGMLFVLWFLNVNLYVVGNEGLFFFCLGAALALGKIKVEFFNVLDNKIWLFIIWIILLSINASLVVLTGKPYWLISKAAMITGLLSIWYNYDILFKALEKRFFALTSLTFFIYAAHEPTLTIIKKLMLKLSGMSVYANLFTYLLAPAITIFLVATLGILVRASLPRVYATLTGGR